MGMSASASDSGSSSMTNNNNNSNINNAPGSDGKSKKGTRARLRRGSDALPPWPDMNADLLCPHGSLAITTNSNYQHYIGPGSSTSTIINPKKKRLMAAKDW